MSARRRVKSGGLPYPPDPSAENRRSAGRTVSREGSPSALADGPARPEVDAVAAVATRNARSARERAGDVTDITTRDGVRARVEI